MSILGGQTLADDRHVWDLPQTDPQGLSGMIRRIPVLGPIWFEGQTVTTAVNSLTPTPGMMFVRTISRTTAIDPREWIGVGLGLEGQTIDLVSRLVEWMTVPQGERAESLGSNPLTRTIPETITPAAEKYAKSHGLYGALVLTKEIVCEMMPSMRALNVDVKKDPDEGGYPTICFTITIQESVDRVLELDDALQDALYERVPADDRLYLSFTYQFE